jgi:hypothetical protein
MALGLNCFGRQEKGKEEKSWEEKGKWRGKGRQRVWGLKLIFLSV